MKHRSWWLAAGSLWAIAALAQKPSPFVGRWDFNLPVRGANWLGITDKSGSLEILFQPTGGNVFKVTDYKLEGSHLKLNLGKDFAWDLEAQGGQLKVQQIRSGIPTALTGVRAPGLQRGAPSGWSSPEPLFNGKDLTGWEPSNPANSHWTVRDGELVNEAKGRQSGNPRASSTISKLHVEYNCPR